MEGLPHKVIEGLDAGRVNGSLDRLRDGGFGKWVVRV